MYVPNGTHTFLPAPTSELSHQWCAARTWLAALDDRKLVTSSLEQPVAFITQERQQDFAVRRKVVNDQNGRHASQVLRFQRSGRYCHSLVGLRTRLPDNQSPSRQPSPFL